jgi:RNA polymerase sigma factor (sigma-70 family)
MSQKGFLVCTQGHTPLPDLTDTVLAQQVKSGDQGAFEVLVQRYRTPLFHFIYRFLADYDLTCDMLQEVFLRFYISLPQLKTSAPFKQWLFHVARNCCVDELRKKRRSALSFSELEVEERENESTDLWEIPDPGPLPEEVVERRDLQALVQEAIRALPPRYRSIMLLRYVAQLSFSEIGEILSMPESTAKTYFHRAKPLLRKRIADRL